jgi:hypothetical protein
VDAQSEIKLGRINIGLLVVEVVAACFHAPPLGFGQRQAQHLFQRGFRRHHPLSDGVEQRLFLMQALHLPHAERDKDEQRRQR